MHLIYFRADLLLYILMKIRYKCAIRGIDVAYEFKITEAAKHVKLPTLLVAPEKITLLGRIFRPKELRNGSSDLK